MFVMKQSARQLLNSGILTRKNLFMPQSRSVPDVREQEELEKAYVGERHKSSGLSGRKRSKHQYDATLCQSMEKPKAVVEFPLNTPCNTTVLSSIRLNGDCAYTVYPEAAERFAEYLKTKL